MLDESPEKNGHHETVFKIGQTRSGFFRKGLPTAAGGFPKTVLADQPNAFGDLKKQEPVIEGNRAFKPALKILDLPNPFGIITNWQYQLLGLKSELDG